MRTKDKIKGGGDRAKILYAMPTEEIQKPNTMMESLRLGILKKIQANMPAKE